MSTPPRSFIDKFRDAAPSYRTGQNEETDALFNPSIEARPLHIPLAGQILKRLNPEMEFFWAFDRNGQNPNHERVEILRSVGFEYATTRDVQMAVASTVQGENEIRNGDRRLMKIPKRRWLEIRKDQQLRAIAMTNSRGKVMGEDGTVMTVGQLIPGVKTQLTDEPIEDIRARAVVSDAAADLRDGQVRGNASRISPEMVNKAKQDRS